jgi:uncharacterized membrane protein YphA (DoxX/SURF4 family)
MSRRRETTTALVVMLVRWVVGGIFLYASLDKLAHPDAFAQVIANYRMVPMPLLHAFAWLLPIVEAVTGAALILGWRRRGASLLAVAMTVMFTVAIATALARGLDISCGCFNTTGGHAVGRDLLLRDLVLLAAALVPLLTRRDRWSLDAWLKQDN